jgi:hypothetical protein
MDKTVPIIGIEPGELRWIRILVSLLRHPDPSVPELTRQALIYLSDASANRTLSEHQTLDHAGSCEK